MCDGGPCREPWILTGIPPYYPLLPKEMVDAMQPKPEPVEKITAKQARAKRLVEDRARRLAEDRACKSSEDRGAEVNTERAGSPA